MAANVMEFTDANWQSEVLDSETPVVVDFWAPWCGPCRQLAPTIEKLAGEYQGKVKIGKLDTDQNSETAGGLRISSIPTVLFIKGGQVVDRLVGVNPEAKYPRRPEQARRRLSRRDCRSHAPSENEFPDPRFRGFPTGPGIRAKSLQREGAEVKTIHKYALHPTHDDRITVMMPIVAKIVMVGIAARRAFPLGHRGPDKPPVRTALPTDRHRPTHPRRL